MNFFNHPGLQGFLIVMGFCALVIASIGFYGALTKTRNTKPYNMDLNRKLYWILGFGEIFLYIFLIYLSTIFPSRLENLYDYLVGIMIFAFAFAIITKSRRFKWNWKNNIFKR